MKKTILIFLIGILLFNQESFAQITLELTEYSGYYAPVKLSSSGYKYVDYSTLISGYFTIRNLDGTLFRTIVLPPPPVATALPTQPFYISETLFDTDSSNIEFLQHYFYLNSYGYYDSWEIVASETGAVLLSEQYASTFEIFTTARYYYSIYGTDQGTKMQFIYSVTDSLNIGQYLYTKIFSLPGNYPTGVNAPLLNTGNIENSLFPNPTTGDASIKLDLPANITNAVIIFYNDGGQIVKQVKVNPSDKLIKVDNTVLPSGTYYYQVLTTPFSKIPVNKMIVVK